MFVGVKEVNKMLITKIQVLENCIGVLELHEKFVIKLHSWRLFGVVYL